MSNDYKNNSDNNISTTGDTTVIKKKKRNTMIVGITVAVVAIAIVARFFLVSGSEDNKLSDTLQLAEQYLNEMDYEKAIATYEEAIKIDPKSADAYCGLADTYVAMADNSIKEGDIDKANEYYDAAINALEDGLNCVLDSDKERLENYKAKIEKLKKEIEETEPTANNIQEENTKYETKIRDDSDLSKAKVGDIVNFGSWYGQPCQWDVLKVEEGKVLLASHYALTCHPFDTKNKETCWEQSEIRQWMNTYLINELFNDEELQRIPLVTITNNGTIDFYKEYYSDSPWRLDEEHLKKGNDTTDKLFLLSYEEAIEYYGPLNLREIENWGYKQAYLQNGAKECLELYDGEVSSWKCYWWLRNAGHYGDWATEVSLNGMLNEYRELGFESGVVPAMYVCY